MTCEMYGNALVMRTPAAQPMTQFRSTLTLNEYKKPRVWWTRYPGNRLFWCHKCRRRRPAKNLKIIVQEWYDPMILCATGKGCTVRGWRKKP